MKRLIFFGKAFGYGSAAALSVFIGMLAFFPASAAADKCTDQGQWTMSDGTCCPPSRVVITTSGSQSTVSCNSQSADCGSTVSDTGAVSCVFQRYINPAIQLLSAAVGILVVVTIIRGGLTYTMSAGDPSKAAAGKQHIINALIGLAAYLMLYVFLQFIIPGGVFN